jgi:acyl-CoA synthetase (NDP forming)/L-amino acid N-acyltransferase YncA
MTWPGHREADVALRDGSTAHVRPARAGDAAAVRAFFERLSPQSTALRFFSGFPNLDRAVAWATEVDFERRYSLLATGGDGRVLAHAGWEREPDRPERAEVALAIADAIQGKGLGTILLGQLAEAADQAGVQVLEAEVLAHNHQMIQVFRDSGFPVTTHAAPGVLLVEVPTLLTPEGLARFERREQAAAAAALRAFLAPRSVAVVGASRRRGTVGGELFHNLLAAGFAGPVYPVNPKAPVVQSVVAYPSVGEVPGPVDLAVLAVPADAVVAAAGECAAAGVRALVVISAGFAETGPEGAERQRQLLAVCRDAGMRLIGPNCLGVVNTNPGVRLDATFGPRPPLPGKVGFLSQSVGLGLAVVDYATKLGLGLSSLVSVGNKADISSNDLLDYWEDDPDTAVALLYLESFGNPRRFSRIARRVGRRKPIVAVKSGRSAAGARASSSPAGALLAASDVTVDALFRQAGVVRTDTLAELFDVARLLASQPHPRGRRVGIVTNAGGPGSLCADACEAAGLEVAELSVAPAERYRRAVEALLASGEVDAAIVVFVPPPLGEPAEVAGAIRAAVDAAGQTIPVLAVFMSAAGSPPELRAGGSAIPSYAFPEDAARALGRAAEYGSWRERPEGQVPDLPDARRDEAAALLAAALAELPAPAWLPPDQVAALLGCYGIAMAPAEAGGVELVVGVVHDPSFGPVVACGAGGVAAELLNDVAVRLTPLTDRDAAEMVRSLASFPLLDGYRGAPRADVAALEDLLLRVGALVEAHPQVAELDLDPVRALACGVVVVDARVRVETASPRPPLASRRR